MNDRKYTFGMFAVGFIVKFFVRFFLLFVLGVIFMVIGFSVEWCSNAARGLFLLDAILSFIEEMEERHKILIDYYDDEPDEFDDDEFDDTVDIAENENNEYSKAFIELKKSITKGMSLAQIVDCFEKMCEAPIEGDNILFETGTLYLTRKKLFYFSLVRQFPNGDGDYYQIHVDVQYKSTGKYKNIHNAEWSDCVDGNFFDYIRNSPAFACASRDEYVGIDIYICKA